MSNRTHVELNKDGRPVVSGFDEFASRHLVHVLLVFFYLVPLTLGLHFDDFFMRSPLVKYSAKVLGFCASTVSWVPAYLIAGIVFGKFYFAKRVFWLYSKSDFSIAMALVFLLAPIALFLARSINRTASSYLHRRFIFCLAVIFTIAALVSIVDYMHPFNRHKVYIFSCFVVGVIYFSVFWQRN